MSSNRNLGSYFKAPAVKAVTNRSAKQSQINAISMNSIEDRMPIDPHYAISGFLVGARVGVTGVGGGSLMTPILIVLFGVSPATGVVEFASNDTGVPKLFTHSVEPFRFEGRA